MDYIKIIKIFSGTLGGILVLILLLRFALQMYAPAIGADGNTLTSFSDIFYNFFANTIDSMEDDSGIVVDGSAVFGAVVTLVFFILLHRLWGVLEYDSRKAQIVDGIKFVSNTTILILSSYLVINLITQSPGSPFSVFIFSVSEVIAAPLRMFLPAIKYYGLNIEVGVILTIFFVKVLDIILGEIIERVDFSRKSVIKDDPKPPQEKKSPQPGVRVPSPPIQPPSPNPPPINRPPSGPPPVQMTPLQKQIAEQNRQQKVQAQSQANSQNTQSSAPQPVAQPAQTTAGTQPKQQPIQTQPVTQPPSPTSISSTQPSPSGQQSAPRQQPSPTDSANLPRSPLEPMPQPPNNQSPSDSTPRQELPRKPF